MEASRCLMSQGAQVGEQATDFGTDFIDVTDIRLSDLDGVEESGLTLALRRLLSEEDSGPVAGFTSSI
ncbi:FxSxx-COOH cyclophane-containing RiPP peptide [Streptosporangium sp. NBC_01639]|uniref:FxSxx-COOH cyclophane-containing RiPP peptide n=1 Tax=Streptosporangium sp. NBC_01639 TaxID=2975948 RepID=UPI00386A1A68